MIVWVVFPMRKRGSRRNPEDDAVMAEIDRLAVRLDRDTDWVIARLAEAPDGRSAVAHLFEAAFGD